MISEETSTTCPYCGVGCGLRVAQAPGGVIGVQGDPWHPANEGRLCVKGACLGETLDLGERLLAPRVNGRGVGWPEAVAAVAEGFARTIAEHGPEAVAFYVSGQLLTEDYYVANKLMKGFIGSANIDTNSRLCMASAVVAHQRAFGADAVPVCYEDLEHADLVVAVGWNGAWTHPVLWRRIEARRHDGERPKLVVIDPRGTATARAADLHLPVKPGTDGFLFNGLLDFLRREDGLDLAYLERHTEGFAETLAAARESAPSIPAVAETCGLAEAKVAEFYRLFARHARVVSVFSQGINQSATGVDKANAIINCHLATGRIGRPGAGPFSITGQPNAMGGREVGGLATQLAAHMALGDPEATERLGRFWQTDQVARAPGLKAIDMFEAIAAGRVRAVWIMATNPAVSLPDADRVRRALEACEMVIVSDCVGGTDTARCADVLLPAAAWGEKDGSVTNSERRISRQRAFHRPPGEARPDWWIITQVARAMGFESAFGYERPAEIFREHARLSGLDNPGRRAFDISALAELSDAEYQCLEPVQWPATRARPGGTKRLFENGAFYTPSGRARLVPIEPRLPATPPTPALPFVLNSGRTRDQWHTMTRTGETARLTAHRAEPYAEIHPADAAALGLRERSLLRVSGAEAEVLVRAELSPAQQRGTVFVPMHWSDAYAARARVGALVPPVTDPISGQPESKCAPVRLERPELAWHGILWLARGSLVLPELEYWARVRETECWRYELADRRAPPDWRAWCRARVGEAGEWIELLDAGAGRYRAACLRTGRLAAVLYVAPEPEGVDRRAVAGLFSEARLSHASRDAVLSGQPRRGAETGDILCTCFSVGETQVARAIAEGCDTVEALGAALGAGAGCGSCLSELRERLERWPLGAAQG
ncbi:MAG: nitrate reductase [Gammaproteobacteria bacterium]|nr:nitrate reductase [Gammaproteobacteria bacterium]NIR82353.1 nitrate reductase [Gammaproteobacteria bacterium]NIR91948.1 nitrate reductase [Gammaproteobacteria bacterium]NIV76976.1 molybdopterin-dependent oxidoreductase [Gammaproteobacteria bacterium]